MAWDLPAVDYDDSDGFIGPFDPLPLFKVGGCPYRPLASNSYVRAPYISDIEPDTQYIPAEMSLKAMQIGLSKYNAPFAKPFTQAQCDFMLERLRRTYGRFFKQARLLSYEEAVSLLDYTKSPGYPWYFYHSDKFDALCEEGDTIMDQVLSILAGEEVECICSLTLKTELRDKIKVQMHKTRVFMAAPIQHLLATHMLFYDQNQKLMENIGNHPITIGIQVPGVEFCRCILTMHERKQGGDGERWDSSFLLQVASLILQFRCSFIDPKYWKGARWIYRCIYSGLVAGLGNIMRCWHNKSGWGLTAEDNSLFLDLMVFIGFCIAYPDLIYENVCRNRFNGDDLGFSSNNRAVNAVRIVQVLKDYGVSIDIADPEPCDTLQLIYLSHHLKLRYVAGLGDIIIAAGNLPKLLSSLSWVKTSKNLTSEEVSVAHLLGLRIALFPWREHFLECDEMLEEYLDKVTPTPFIEKVIHARLSEYEIALIHCRVEGLKSIVTPKVEKALVVINSICM